jgi:hypothetical protein
MLDSKQVWVAISAADARGLDPTGADNEWRYVVFTTLALILGRPLSYDERRALARLLGEMLDERPGELGSHHRLH